MIVARAHQEQTHCKCYDILHIENFNENYILTFLIGRVACNIPSSRPKNALKIKANLQTISFSL